MLEMNIHKNKYVDFLEYCDAEDLIVTDLSETNESYFVNIEGNMKNMEILIDNWV